MQHYATPLFFCAIPFTAAVCLGTLFPVSETMALSFLVLTLLSILILKLGDRLLPVGRAVFLGVLVIVAGFCIGSTAQVEAPELPVDAQTFSGLVEEARMPRAGRQQVILKLKGLMNGDSLVSQDALVVLTVSESAILRAGDEIAFTTELKRIENKGNPGEFDAERYYSNKRIFYRGFVSNAEYIAHHAGLTAFFADLRDGIAAQMAQYLEDDALAIGKALILGDKSDLNQELMQSFSATGTTHVLAVSGLHIGLILLLLQRFLQLFYRFLSRRQAIVISVLIIAAYGLLTGAAPSVMRAVVTFGIISGSQLFRRGSSPLNALGVAAIVQLAWNPLDLFDIGFQLSYLALIGIFVLYRPIADLWKPKNNIIRLGWEGTAAGLAATIATTPVVLYNFYRFPNYFALANLGMLVLGFAVLAVGIIFLVTSFIPYLSKITALFFSLTVIALVLWVGFVDSLPGAVSGGFQWNGWEVTIALLIVVLWMLRTTYKRIPLSALLAVTALFITFESWKRWQVVSSNELVIMNANQFCMVIKLEDHCYAIYDADRNGSWQIPDEAKNYAAFVGGKLIPLKFEGRRLSGKIGSELVALNRQKDGLDILIRNQNLFYRKRGIPHMKEDQRLFSPDTRLYVQSDVNGAFRKML